MAKRTNLKTHGVVFILLVFMFPAIALADVIYVDANSPPGGDCLTWETAFNYLQDALDVA